MLNTIDIEARMKAANLEVRTGLIQVSICFLVAAEGYQLAGFPKVAICLLVSVLVLNGIAAFIK